ncbi:MAG: ABC transporter ATP-binding protein, partial [Pseudomonadota bacterium]
MTLLSIRQLGLSIGQKSILRDVSFDIGPGQIVAITGESGSGKSMTAFSIMGLLPKTAAAAGQILINGIDVLSLPEAEMCNLRGDEIGMVFQEPMTALNPVHTIGRQVAETIRLHRSVTRAEANQIAAKTLERVGLPPDQFPPGRYPHELSGGQRQRVVIAMAIACQPRLLIADEPTTALDVTTQAKIIDLLRQLVREDGMGLLMITHDLALVAGLADRVVVMRTGEVIEQNSTTELLSNMRHPYTRMLFEASTHTVNLPAANTTRP